MDKACFVSCVNLIIFREISDVSCHLDVVFMIAYGENNTTLLHHKFYFFDICKLRVLTEHYFGVFK
jgi:hypothetical protein